jgi:hypothetical protein
MNPLKPYRYLLDTSGKNQNNRVEGEFHDLESRKYRSVTPKYGLFFSKSVSMMDAVTQKELTRDVDYVCIDTVAIPTMLCEQDVCSTIVVINPRVNSRVILSYQCLGDGYEHNYAFIQTLLNELLQDDRPISWENVVTPPSEVDPVTHYQTQDNTIGYEFLCASLEMLRKSILMGDQVSHNALYRYIDQRFSELTAMVDTEQSDLSQMALVRATNALRATEQAMLKLIQAHQSSGDGIEELQKLQSKLEAISARDTNAEKDAKQLLSGYTTVLAQSAAFITTPAQGSPYQTLQFGKNQVVSVDNYDAYVVTKNGQALFLTRTEFEIAGIQDFAFIAKLQLIKSPVGGYAGVRLSFMLVDSRINGRGGYCSDAFVTVSPLILSSLSRLPQEVYATSTEMEVLNYTPTSVGNYYQVLEEDQNPILIGRTTPEKKSASERICSFLFDMRADFNVTGIASVNSRKAVRFQLPRGTELSLIFGLNGKNIDQIRKDFIVPFSHSFDIRRADDGSDQIQVEKPYAEKVRSLTAKF